MKRLLVITSLVMTVIFATPLLAAAHGSGDRYGGKHYKSWTKSEHRGYQDRHHRGKKYGHRDHRDRHHAGHYKGHHHKHRMAEKRHHYKRYYDRRVVVGFPSIVFRLDL